MEKLSEQLKPLLHSPDLPRMKVIGIDSWTKGILHFKRIVNAFEARDIEFLLVHIGSFGYELGRSPVEIIDGVKVRDISAYATKSIRCVLEAEKPSAVIVLSPSAFQHRTAIRYCRVLKIPTIYLAHGMYSLADPDMKEIASIGFFRRLWNLRRLGWISLRYTWPRYAHALFANKAPLADWWGVLWEVINKLRGRVEESVSHDCITDKAIVFVDYDRKFLVKKWGYLPRNVIAVGNPDLIKFGLETADFGSLARNATQDNRKVLYLDTCRVEYGSSFRNEYEYAAYLKRLSDGLREQGKQLVLKPHPLHWDSVISCLKQAGIKLCLDEEFKKDLGECCACIVEPSSIALIPALLGLPVLLARFDSLEQESYGQILMSYPRVRDLTDIARFGDTLAEERATFDTTLIERWIEANAGPLPPAEMPSRIVDIVISLIKEKSISREHR